MLTYQIQIILSSAAFLLNAFLGITVILKNHKSWTHRLFFNLVALANLYIVVNFLSLHPPEDTPESQLFWIRVVMFVCSFIGPNLVILTHTFPYERIRMKTWQLAALLVLMVASATASLLPLVFSSITYPGGNPSPQPGPGMPIFFLDFVGLFILSFIILITRYRRAQGELKLQMRYLLWGVLGSFSLMGLFTVTFVAIFHNSGFVFLGPIFPVILMAFIAYAIVKHQLFDIKVIATEALTIIMGIILLSRIFTGSNLIDIIIFAAFVIFGSLLIKSVRNEVAQRQQLESITQELSEANEKLTALDQARAEFISIASHQLRTPPATVKWYLSALIAEDYGPLEPKVKETLKRAERTNNLLISLIEDILNVSRIERGKLEFLFEPCNLEEMAYITFEQLEPLALEKEQSLTYSPPLKDVPRILADKEKLRQVMNNLIDNAIKYTPRGGTIGVSLDTDDKCIKFSVTDSGKGINPKDIGKLFEKYTRGRQSFKHTAGLGLGLYVAKIIIAEHKGKIWAESAGEEKGSTFAFTLPLDNSLKETTMVDLVKSEGRKIGASD